MYVLTNNTNVICCLTIKFTSLSIQLLQQHLYFNMTCSVFPDPPSVKLSALPPQANNVPVTLYCDVDSFYPEQVSLSWLQNGTVLPDPPTIYQNLDGTFKTRRYYTLSPAQREQAGKVECAVYQPGAAQPVSSAEDLAILDPRGTFPTLYCKIPVWINIDRVELIVWMLFKDTFASVNFLFSHGFTHICLLFSVPICVAVDCFRR